MTSFLPRFVGVGSIKLFSIFHRSYTPGVYKHGSYEGDGKTTVTILNNDLEHGLMINGISSAGFQLNNGMWILGPAIVFPKSVIGWNIESSDDINEDSLTLFKVLQPTLDILVVGLDKKYDNKVPFMKILRSFAKNCNFRIEILQTEYACAAFNFLNTERRYVAAALLPPIAQIPKAMKALENIRVRRSLSIEEKKLSSK